MGGGSLSREEQKVQALLGPSWQVERLGGQVRLCCQLKGVPGTTSTAFYHSFYIKDGAVWGVKGGHHEFVIAGTGRRHTGSGRGPDEPLDQQQALAETLAQLDQESAPMLLAGVLLVLLCLRYWLYLVLLLAALYVTKPHQSTFQLYCLEKMKEQGYGRFRRWLVSFVLPPVQFTDLHVAWLAQMPSNQGPDRPVIVLGALNRCIWLPQAMNVIEVFCIFYYFRGLQYPRLFVQHGHDIAQAFDCDSEYHAAKPL
eukprot:g78980.t1